MRKSKRKQVQDKENLIINNDENTQTRKLSLLESQNILNRFEQKETRRRKKSKHCIILTYLYN